MPFKFKPVSIGRFRDCKTLIHQYMSLANTSGLSYSCAVGTFGREETTRSLRMMELLYVELCQHANPKQACGKLGCQRKREITDAWCSILVNVM
jgi:hypothetical protein